MQRRHDSIKQSQHYSAAIYLFKHHFSYLVRDFLTYLKFLAMCYSGFTGHYRSSVYTKSFRFPNIMYMFSKFCKRGSPIIRAKKLMSAIVFKQNIMVGQLDDF